MLTGIPTNITQSRSLTASTSTIGERSKDALVRINELIRQNSVQDVEIKMNENIFDDHDALFSSMNFDKRRQINEMSPIQFYINETNKLTSNLENSIHEQTIAKQQQEDKINVTNLDDINIQQVKKISFYFREKINSMNDRLI
jgi:hypothetical protein